MTRAAMIGMTLLAGCAGRSPVEYRDATQATLVAQVPAIKSCYDRALVTDKTAQGTIAVRFAVAEDTGVITGATVDAARTTAPAALVDCVVGSLSGLAVSPADSQQGQASFVWQLTPGSLAAPTPRSVAKIDAVSRPVVRKGAVASEYATLRPTARFAKASGKKVRASILGLIDPETSRPIVLEPGKTLVILEDGQERPLTVVREPSTGVAIDVIFAVDNSGSMGEEADGIAAKIVAFANLLGESALDARFAVVGQNGEVLGAIDLDSEAAVEAYLKRNLTGTSRTKGFGGPAATKLQQEAADARKSMVDAENVLSAIVFAERTFSWRPNAQRVFINFTDEATQPKFLAEWSTGHACGRWTASSGVVHTVWSGPDFSTIRWQELRRENPAALSRCTGGVVMGVEQDASDLDLTALPMTAALRSSVVVEFESADPTKAHDLVVVVKGASKEGRSEYKSQTY